MFVFENPNTAAEFLEMFLFGQKGSSRIKVSRVWYPTKELFCTVQQNHVEANSGSAFL